MNIKVTLTTKTGLLISETSVVVDSVRDIEGVLNSLDFEGSGVVRKFTIERFDGEDMTISILGKIRLFFKGERGQ